MPAAKQGQGDCNALGLDSDVVVGAGNTGGERSSGTTGWRSTDRKRE
jgi:hypothetical protein